MTGKGLAIVLTALLSACAGQVQELDPGRSPGSRALELKLAAKDHLRDALEETFGKTALYLVDRSMELDVLEAYLSASAELGIFSTSIVLEARRDVKTPAVFIKVYATDWLPKWILQSAESFDVVFLGTYWNHEAFLSPNHNSNQQWIRLPYLDVDRFLSDEARFPEEIKSALKEAIGSELQEHRNNSLHIWDPEGTELEVRDSVVDQAQVRFPMKARGQLVFTIHQGLIPPMEWKIQEGQVVEILGGGQLGDEFRRRLTENPLSLLEISFGVNPKAKLPENFTRHVWTAWIRVWSAMNDRSGTVRYKLGVPGHDDEYWHFANFYSTVKLGNEELIKEGHLAILDSPQLQAMLSEEDKRSKLFEESWSPYPKHERPER